MTETNQVLLLLGLFQIKHVVADFFLQSQYILRNRRVYGHPGGLLHVTIHLLGSLAVLWLVGTAGWILAALLVAEAVVHYHLDWAKDNLVLRRRWTPSDATFWWATGIDQALHQATYLAMAAVWATTRFGT